MRKYGKIPIEFWAEKTVKRLSDDAKLLAVYCLTSEHSNAIGCYRLPVGYIKTDLSWEPAKVEAALDELVRLQFIMRDPDTDFIFIPYHLKWNPIENSKVGRMCVDLVYAAARAPSIFPSLIAALRPMQERFTLGDKNHWDSAWDTLSDTVSHTVSDTLCHTVSQDENPSRHTVSDTVSQHDSSPQNTVSSLPPASVEIVPPEPEPEPEPEPSAALHAGAQGSPVDVIKVFDDALVAVFGEERRRPWPKANDSEYARAFLAAGADLELCRALFLNRQQACKDDGKEPIDTLGYFKNAIPETLRMREQLRRQQPNSHLSTEVVHETLGRHQGQHRPRTAHHAFTEAAINVLYKRRQD